MLHTWDERQQKCILRWPSQQKGTPFPVYYQVGFKAGHFEGFPNSVYAKFELGVDQQAMEQGKRFKLVWKICFCEFCAAGEGTEINSKINIGTIERLEEEEEKRY